MLFPFDPYTGKPHRFSHVQPKPDHSLHVNSARARGDVSALNARDRATLNWAKDQLGIPDASDRVALDALRRHRRSHTGSAPVAAKAMVTGGVVGFIQNGRKWTKRQQDEDTAIVAERRHGVAVRHARALVGHDRAIAPEVEEEDLDREREEANSAPSFRAIIERKGAAKLEREARQKADALAAANAITGKEGRA